jgi:hypothetical protein
MVQPPIDPELVAVKVVAVIAPLMVALVALRAPAVFTENSAVDGVALPAQMPWKVGVIASG